MTEIICDDCPLNSILFNIKDLAVLVPSDAERRELNELAEEYCSRLGALAADTVCSGPKVAGAVCGLDTYAKLNYEIHENYKSIKARK